MIAERVTRQRGKGNEAAYIRTDWSMENKVAREIKIVLRNHHQYLNAGLDQRHRIYQR